MIENAIKYSGDPAKVEVVCREVDGMIAIDVKDNELVSRKSSGKRFSNGITGFTTVVRLTCMVLESV